MRTITTTMTAPLRAHFSTSDPDEMTENVSAISPDVTIEKRAAGRFLAKTDGLLLNNMSMALIRARNIHVTAEPQRHYTSVTIPLRLGFDVARSGRHDHIDGNVAHVQNLDVAFDLSSTETSVLVINIQNEILASAASKLTCGKLEPSIDLHDEISLSGRHGATMWRTACSLWLDASKGPGVSATPSAEREHQLIDNLLLAAGIRDGPEPTAIQARRAVARISRVEDWILANLERPISRADLCEISGLQVRALSRYFVKKYGISPMQFVRARRLDAIFKSLLASGPAETNVSRTALDYGFYHLSRFAAEYRAAFGEYPVETLHR